MMLRIRYTRPLLAAALLMPLLAQAWWQADWKFRKPLTVQPPAEETGLAASDVPVLLRLHAGNFGFFADTKPDGADLRLMAGDDATPLKYHIERYDPATGMGLVWLRAPQLASGAPLSAILYYGNADAPPGDDMAGTYDADQALVFHFGETSGAARDATANGNNASASTAQPQPGSLIGGGLRLTDGQTVTVPGSASMVLEPAKGLTITLWLKLDEPTANGAVLEFGPSGQGLLLGLAGGVPYLSLGAGQVKAATPIPAGAWHHLAVTLGGGQATVYLDGVPTGQGNLTLTPLAGALILGAGPTAQAAGLTGVTADIDELGVARVARSAGWLRLAALSQGTDAGLVSYGEDETADSGGQGSYIGVVLKNVTVDGWVIIGLLGAMSAISWVVMFGKARFLVGARRANVKFLEAFRTLGDSGLTALAARPDFGPAPLQRVCSSAVEELRTRLHRSVGAQATVLSPQALEAVRTRVDAAAVREQQRLNSGMVLLTIAISGGPFLGLLGTVVGVMITFAAIAASGEVNVNSIAPGIAASLVATVAGLLVAIPALFGYNYLGTLIRDTTTDLRVFVDELIAGIAEQNAA